MRPNAGAARDLWLRVGDTVDFYRVERYEADRLLILLAELKLPGRAWLQFEVQADPAGARVEQTAFFEPRGVLGHVYWAALLPIHRFVFPGLLRSIKERAETASGSKPGA